MRVEFTNGGSLIDAANLTASSFSVSGGSVSGISKVADGNYTFAYPDYSRYQRHCFHGERSQGCGEQGFVRWILQVRFGIGGLYRPDILIGYWNFDEGSGNKAQNSGTAGPLKVGTLHSGATFNTSDKKFGASSLRLSDSNTGSRVLVANPLDLGGTIYAATFTVSPGSKKSFRVVLGVLCPVVQVAITTSSSKIIRTGSACTTIQTAVIVRPRPLI